MKAYTLGISKKEFVSEMKAHQKADAFLSGTYFGGSKTKFKGCAVGCGIEAINRRKGLELSHSDHSQYAEHLGIPEWLARVEDTVFEGVSPERRKTWPVEFAQAINQGADLEAAKAPFLIFVLESVLTKFDHAKFPYVKTCVDQSIALWKRSDIGSDEWNEAAWAAAWVAAEGAARAAAWAAAWAAAEGAAEGAARAAWAAAAEGAAEGAAEYEKFADKLLEILSGIKGTDKQGAV